MNDPTLSALSARETLDPVPPRGMASKARPSLRAAAKELVAAILTLLIACACALVLYIVLICYAMFKAFGFPSALAIRFF